MTSGEVVARHRDAGRRFEADGTGSFVLEEGDGDPVVCMHGVPASSFLYRKMLAELAARGLRGVAFDLPGLGLADRPAGFDYTWTGLGRFCVAAVDALGLERFHLVVHDIGGPVGFELAAAVPERVVSLTVLNTLVQVDTFKRPWSMEPFARRGVGDVYLRTLSKPAFRVLMRLQGIEDIAAVPREELDAYVDLLRGSDGGRAFLQIMRGFERTPEKRRPEVDAAGEEHGPLVDQAEHHADEQGDGQPDTQLRPLQAEAHEAAERPPLVRVVAGAGRRQRRDDPLGSPRGHLVTQ
jgi:haloalkane dehalogenase